MATPSREEIIAYIRELAARKGIDPETFLKIVEGESGFNPAAVGDKGQSFGLAQLYMGGGLGNTYEQQFGSRPDNPEDWKQQLAFMADQAVGGGKGWEPWHAAKRVGIEDPWQGLPSSQTVAQPGRRGRSGEVAQSQSRMVQPYQPVAPGTGKQQEARNPFGMTPEEWQDATNPKGAQTVGGAIVDMFVPGRSELRKSERSQTALGGLLSAFEPPKSQEEIEATEVKGYNPMAPMSKQTQLSQLAKKKNLGSNLFGLAGLFS